jgi:6-phosphogluconolactonase
MIQNLHIYKNPDELANQFAGQLMNWVGNHSGNEFHLAISGGKTPDLLFDILSEKYPDSVLWQKVHFWWVDERMVPPTHPESNFGVVQNLLFSKIAFPEENIHRIKGENTPEKEVFSYSAQIQEKLKQQNGWPVFDLIILGMGDDGHTASIFPDQMELLVSEKICEVATHPVSGQKRVTMTGKVINSAREICFLVTGSNKAKRIDEIFEQRPEAEKLPANYIKTKKEEPEWYLDEAAGFSFGESE